MPDYRFERECRTPYSEAYNIMLNEEPIGRIDLHFTAYAVTATLCVGESMTREEIQELIDTVDEEIVLPAEVARDDFIVTVYQGREAGVFSDEELRDEEEFTD